MSNANKFNRRWFMIDIARQQTFSREEFIDILDTLKRLDYNGIGMYFECAFEFKNYPGVVRENVMTYEDAKWFVEECKKRDIYAFPMTNVAGHMNHFYGLERNRELFSNGVPFQLDFQHEKAKEFVMGYVKEYIDAFGADMINIGGDEVSLDGEEQTVAYAKFIGEICSELLKLGVRPSIWGDMFVKTPELCEFLDKDTIIFDWCYHGHHPDTLQIFIDKGFKDIVACNCDNGWIGLINQQSGGKLYREDMPVALDEVEPFLEDSKNLGLMNGMVTDWENYIGRNLWGQWAPIARCALFMNGEVEARACKDDQIDNALFGRITGYAEATRVLQDGLQPADIPAISPPHNILFSLRTGIHEPNFFEKVMNQLIKEKPTYFDNYDVTIEKAEAILDKWVPETYVEQRCLSALYKIISMARVVSCMVKIAKGYHSLYVKAAALQFETTNVAKQYLNRFENLIRHTQTEIRSYRDMHTTAVEKTGYSKNDYVKLNIMYDRVGLMADYVHQFSEVMDRIPLPRIEALLAQSMVDKFHDWGLKL